MISLLEAFINLGTARISAILSEECPSPGISTKQLVQYKSNHIQRLTALTMELYREQATFS